ncbi:hypothetical protein [Pontibacter sp. G13]|uniref:hypothetical protein n=1 Tax=Pontibacter sp. G13 TaxID=3074898 RepID=UPI00288AF08A|nr:hypothetical protein [Pontibacter sp. G13]WNJ21488.1 hypothetical protein RJD25_13545 [Pontibacter sp. G13]
MKKQVIDILTKIYYSLPIQLLARQIRHHKVLLAFWLVLLGMISGAIGGGFGGSYLYLEPEYLGKESFWSLLIVGCTLGAFLFAYMIAVYINESYRLHFIVFTKHPFYTISYNNFLIPGAFVILYFWKFISYHTDLEGSFTWDVGQKVLGLVLGIALVFLASATYFFAKKSLINYFGDKLEEKIEHARAGKNRKVLLDKAKESYLSRQKVSSYLSFPVKVNHVEVPEGIPFRDIVKSMNQHHGKLLLIQLLTFLVLAILGLLEGNRYFQIPAGASFMLILALGMMIIGAIAFWFRKSGVLTVLGIFGFVMLYNQLDIFQEKHQAFGLDYNEAPAAYSEFNLRRISSQQIYETDRRATLETLEKWKANYQAKYGPKAKPKAVLVTASGGGLRSAFWTFRVLQHIDSLTHGRMSDELRFMSGASGGMFGQVYFRELYRMREAGEISSIQGEQFRDNISNDLLNRLFFKIFTDMILPNRKVSIGSKDYDWETGYSFDQQLSVNMPELSGKTLGDYIEDETAGKIPTVVLSPTVLSYGRQLYISASPVSYLTRPNRITDRYLSRSRGIEFRRMFKKHDADSLLMTTALRMNATFPIIMPVLELPSEPLMEVMDAGAIDNYGTQSAIKYLFEFREWFAENTDGVILLQVRDNDRVDPIRKVGPRTGFSKTLAPLGGGYNSIAEAKDLANEYLLEFVQEWFDGYVEVIPIEYPRETSRNPASLSWHLTRREKISILNSLHTYRNQQAFMMIQALYQPDLLANNRRISNNAP